MTTNPTRGNQFKTLDAFMANKMAEFQESIKQRVDKMVTEQLGVLATELKKASAEIATQWEELEMEKQLIQKKKTELERANIFVFQTKEAVERSRNMLVYEFGREKQQFALEKQEVERQRQEVASEKKQVERQRQEVASEKKQVERQRQEVASEKQQVALDKQHVERQRQEVETIQLDLERQLETMEHYLLTAQTSPTTPSEPLQRNPPPPVELEHEQGTTDTQPPPELDMLDSTHPVEVKLEVMDSVNILPSRACSSRTKTKPDRYTYNPKKKPSNNKSPLVVSSSMLSPIVLDEDDKENMAPSQERINLENTAANQEDLEPTPVSASKKKRSLEKR